ncbi:MAG TPA: hypothetical protein VJ729_02775 [Nitrososphaeraceae archaeon]|nr:hypothetical protein [Nitrososphaeraceae archaeon]
MTSLLILVAITLSNILVNSTYGQTVESPFPQFPMIPPAVNSTNHTKITSEGLRQPASLNSTALPNASRISSTNNTNISSKASTSQSLLSLISHGVRITTPVKGQQVPSGSALKISGTSRDNSTSDCHVNVIVNDVKPYQNASATGTGGPNDYSNWTFNLTSKYTLVKQGENKITAKFSCDGNPALSSFFSVNLTGVTPKAQRT